MAAGDPPRLLDDLIIRSRAGLNTRTGRKEPRYWLDAIAGSGGIAFLDRDTALAAGRRRAELTGVSLWEDVTCAANQMNGTRFRLDVSFRSPGTTKREDQLRPEPDDFPRDN